MFLFWVLNIIPRGLNDDPKNPGYVILFGQ